MSSTSRAVVVPSLDGISVVEDLSDLAEVKKTPDCWDSKVISRLRLSFQRFPFSMRLG